MPHPSPSYPLRARAVCGPSGVGKSTLIARLRAEFPDDFGFSVSHTTRKPRPGEEDGVHYNFADKPAMEAEIAAGKFVESANVHGNLYGTSFAAVERVSAAGKICILDIDVQGVASCRRVQFEVGRYIFVAPPELSVLESRLRGRGECVGWGVGGGGGDAVGRRMVCARRPSHVPLSHSHHGPSILAGTETEEALQKRLSNAGTEISSASSMWWDSWVVNDDLDRAYAQLKACIPSLTTAAEPMTTNKPLPVICALRAVRGHTCLPPTFSPRTLSSLSLPLVSLFARAQCAARAASASPPSSPAFGPSSRTTSASP